MSRVTAHSQTRSDSQRPMQRVIVIGCGGAGKSAFSRQLAQRTGLPLHHLDALYWQPGWTEPSKHDWQSRIDALLAQPRWILDGNFGGTLERRLAASDAVVFMDTPALVCLWRVILRRIRHHGHARPGMAAGCNERLDMGFVAWILGYPFRRRPALLRRLQEVRTQKQVVVLRSTAQANILLDSIRHR